MAVLAPISNFKMTNYKIYIAACLIFGGVFAYDGYLSKYEWSLRRSFYEKHVNEGKPDDTMIFNRVSPIILAVVAVILAAKFWSLKDRKILAEEDRLIISEKEKIPYSSIQKIDKTNFNPTRGFFTITCKGDDGREVVRKISSKDYDNLQAVLDLLVAKIS
jgi:hypothetical protein